MRSECQGFSLAQLAKKLFGAVVGETEISPKELLIEQRRAQEPRKLLLLHRVTREGQDVTVSDKDGASQPAFAGAQKSQLTLDQRYAHGVAAEVEILDVIDLAGFDAQGVERLVDFARACRCRPRRCSGRMKL